MNIYLIRHTRVKLEAGICYGQTDVPLAESFVEECAQVRQKLPVPQESIVYSSPLKRCWVLARQLQPQGEIFIDRRLIELNFGDWELQHWDEIGAGDLKTWTADFVNQRCPKGESYRELFDRVSLFWEECMLQKHDNVFIVTHGGVIRALLTYVLDIPLEKSLRIGVEFGGITKIHTGEDLSMIEYINR